MTMQRIYRSPEPFFWTGTGDRQAVAILLIHGFTGTPSEMRRLGYYLNDQHYTVKGILLPGHGTTPQDMLRTGWSDWWKHVLRSFDELKRQGYEQIVVAGHSMGGLLALKLSVERQVSGVVSLAAPVFLTSRKSALAVLLQYAVRYIKKKPSAIPSLVSESCAYTQTPVRCVVSLRRLMKLVRCSLPLISAPALVAQGGRDGTVRPESAHYIYEKIASPLKELKVYSESSHGLLLDAERERIYRDVGGFVEKVAVLSRPLETVSP